MVSGYKLVFNVARCLRVRQKPSVFCPPLRILPRPFTPFVPLYLKDRGVSEFRNSIPLMKAKLNRGGRPTLTEGKRTKKIDVRFTEYEYQLILQWEQTLGITKTELIRGRVLKNTHEVIINAKTLIEQIDSIGAELGRCGNNINQLARHANILNKSGKLSPDVIAAFNLLFTDYLGRVEKLEIALRKVIRNGR